MSALIERILYVTLLLVFIGVGIAVYVAFSFGHKLDEQLKGIERLNRDQLKTIEQLKKNQEELKADSEKNTHYLECIINLHAQGLAPNDQSCRTEPIGTQLASSQPTQTSTTSQTVQTPQPGSQAQKPEPPKPITQQIQEFATSLVRTLL